MPTTCSVIQFIEPDPLADVSTDANDHSLPIEEGGVLPLVVGVTSYPIDFVQDKLSDTYNFIVSDLINTVDPDPIDLTWIFTARDKTGFTVQFNTPPNTVNYKWNWLVRVPSLPL